MSSKEKKAPPKEIGCVPPDFEDALNILSSLGIEEITFSSEKLRKLLGQCFPNLSEDQVESLVKIFSKN